MSNILNMPCLILIAGCLITSSSGMKLENRVAARTWHRHLYGLAQVRLWAFVEFKLHSVWLWHVVRSVLISHAREG